MNISHTFILLDNDTLPIFVGSQPDQFTVVHENDVVMIPCHAVGTPEPVVRWFIRNYHTDNVAITTDHRARVHYTSNGTLVLSPVRLSDQKVYTCVAENAVGRNSWIIVISVYSGKYTFYTPTL